MTDENTIVYTAVYGDKDGALVDLEKLEQLHAKHLLGTYDAAVIDKEDGLPHVVKRVDGPPHRVAPELFGGGTLPRHELHEAAGQLSEGEAALIVLGEPTLEKAFEEAVTHAIKVARAFETAAGDPFES
jgi:hypothetical protein